MKNFKLFADFIGAKKLENGTAIYLMQRSAEVSFSLKTSEKKTKLYVHTCAQIRVGRSGVLQPIFY